MKAKKLLLGLMVASLGLGLAGCKTEKPTETPEGPTQSDQTPSGPSTGDTTPSTPSNPSTGDTTPSTPSNPSTGDTTPSTPSNPSTGDTSGNISNGVSSGAIDSGNGEIVSESNELNITSCSGTSESGYVEYNKVNGATDYAIYIKGGKYSDYTKLDYKNQYTQQLTNGKMRTDLLGLGKGTYLVKIVPIISAEDETKSSVCRLEVVEYDRSGYAHFNNTEGVGAYNDDGSLKDNAIVIYVTDNNKNSVTLTYGDKTVKGIGNILNSAGQKCHEAGHENECKKISKGKTYYAKGNENEGIIKTLAENNVPLVVRFVGCVSNSGLYKQATFDANSTGLIEGLTSYSSNDFGGTEGDNGHMARMKSGKNITLEGVGTDAVIDGWGIHFMCESSAPTLGKNFEVRNICFMNNPEDALGMEGVQSDKLITASVERCWVHHSTFLKPTISSPAESDKADGDGSCDFKRGQYFTMSYCYYEYCHKTNLIGSSDDSLQYNISFHHSVWYNCGSRIPLLRQANVHFYNNYIYGDSNDKNADLSYATSLRANCYMYAENNYYEGCKNLMSSNGGSGAAKLYGNIMVQCFGEQTGEIVSNREQRVSSNSTYNGTSYANFDTNADLFYYNTAKKQSDCYLTTAKIAREECIKYAGSQYRTVLNKTTLPSDNTDFNIETPIKSVTVPSTNILPTSKTSGEVNGIYWAGSLPNALTGYTSGKVKFRGKAATFKLDTYATVTMEFVSGSTAALNDGALVGQDGTVYLTQSGSVVLAPGIYVIVSCQKDKDSTISNLTFGKYDSTALKEGLIEDYNNAYNKIPAQITYTPECYELIKDAVDKYNALGDYKSEVSTSPVLAYNSYVALGVTYVEDLIDAIGVVDADSYNKIFAARDAYDKLLSISQDVVVSNYATLQQAEVSYKGFAVNACIDAINAIGEVTLSSEALISKAESLYNSLTTEQKALVTNSSVLQQAKEKYTNLQKANALDILARECDLTLASEMLQVISEFNKLTAEQKALVTEITTISNIKVQYTKTLIDAIGVVTKDSKEAINKARDMYDLLDSNEVKAVGDEYKSKLEAAEEAIKGMVLEYTYIKTYADIDGLANEKTYSDDIISCKLSAVEKGYLKLKQGNGDYINITGVNGSTKVTLIINASVDSKEINDVMFDVNYADNTKETKILKTAKDKAYSDLTLELDGKTISSISIKGITGKNCFITSIKVIYEK